MLVASSDLRRAIAHLLGLGDAGLPVDAALQAGGVFEHFLNWAMDNDTMLVGCHNPFSFSSIGR
jgi:hypothetical protein